MNPDREPAQIPLSALEHYAYCPRQCGLILLESGYADDANTVRGTLLHRRVHEPAEENRPGVRTLRALPVWNDELGLTGVCDVVEILDDGAIIPIEHKSGRYHPGGPADLQVAGQALCLEERFNVTIPLGYIYSSADRRRHAVPIDPKLRSRVCETTQAVRNIITRIRLPGAAADKRCTGCSMKALCMPKILAGHNRYQQALTQRYVPSALDE